MNNTLIEYFKQPKKVHEFKYALRQALERPERFHRDLVDIAKRLHLKKEELNTDQIKRAQELINKALGKR